MSSLGPKAAAALAVALAGGGTGPPAGAAPPDGAVDQLSASYPRADLEAARAELLARISQRSDDFQATAALQLVNKALARVGWYDPYNWKHRRKP